MIKVLDVFKVSGRVGRKVFLLNTLIIIIFALSAFGMVSWVGKKSEDFGTAIILSGFLFIVYSFWMFLCNVFKRARDIHCVDELPLITELFYILLLVIPGAGLLALLYLTLAPGKIKKLNAEGP